MALHLVTGYAGAAHITPTDTASFNVAMFGSGRYVLPRGNRFEATALTANSVEIKDGDLVLQGRHIRLNAGSTETVTIESGAQNMMRRDLIVCRYSKNSSTGVESAALVVVKGTAASSNPQDPTVKSGNILDGNATVCDFPLYRVNLNGINVTGIDTLFTVYTAGNMTKAAYDSNSAVQNAGGISAFVTNQTSALNSFKNEEQGVTVPVLTENWGQNSKDSSWRQTVTVSGVTASMNPGVPVAHVEDADMDSFNVDITELSRQVGLIKLIRTRNGSITFVCPDEKPTYSMELYIPMISLRNG